MKRILVSLMFCGALLGLFLATSALSSQVSGLTKSLEQLLPADLLQVIANLQVAPVPKTGQTTKYENGDDGDLQKGITWPDPRFTDNNNGTVTDNLTGLIWLKQPITPFMSWLGALGAVASLGDGSEGLTDGSMPGDWRLPNVKELQSLVDFSQYNPALPQNHPFTIPPIIPGDGYWSSTTYALATGGAWALDVWDGDTGPLDKSGPGRVWAVRGGK